MTNHAKYGVNSLMHATSTKYRKLDNGALQLKLPTTHRETHKYTRRHSMRKVLFYRTLLGGNVRNLAVVKIHLMNF